MKKLLLLILLSSITLLSCETLVNNVSPDKVNLKSEGLAVSCFISPQDTLVTAFVTLTNPLYSDRKEIYLNYSFFNGDTIFYGKSAIVNNAKVFLKNIDSKEEVELKYESQYKAYVFRPFTPNSTFKISEGNYELSVSKEQFNLKSTTNVPALVQDNFETSYDLGIEKYSFSRDTTISIEINSNIEWLNNKGENALFRVRGSLSFFTNQFKRIQSNQAPTIEKNRWDRRVFFDNFGIFDGSALTSSNRAKLKGGANIQTELYDSEGYIHSDIELDSITLELITINKDYLQFYETYSRNRESNPFVEPTSIYSNIEGGVGIFAGCNRAFKTINIDEELPEF